MFYHSAELDFPFGSMLAKNLLNQVPDFKFECIRANLSQVIKVGEKEYPLSLYLDKLKTRFSWGRRFQNENTQSEIGGIQLSELLYQIEDLIDPRAGTRYTIRVHTDHRSAPHNLIVIECRDERQQASLRRHLTRDHFFDDAIDLVTLRARKLVDVQVTKYVAKKQQVKTVNFADSNYAST